MTKYKIVGIINLILGVLHIIPIPPFLLFTLPRLTTLYSEFSVNRPPLTSTYFALGFSSFIGAANFFLGFKLFSKSEEIQKRYFKYGVVLALLGLASPLFLRIASLMMVLRIYNLVSQF